MGIAIGKKPYFLSRKSLASGHPSASDSAALAGGVASSSGSAAAATVVKPMTLAAMAASKEAGGRRIGLTLQDITQGLVSGSARSESAVPYPNYESNHRAVREASAARLRRFWAGTPCRGGAARW